MDINAVAFDPRSPEFRANPYPAYDMLRVAAPVLYWDVWGVWFLSRYDDCSTLLRDPRLGHAEMEGEPPEEQRALFEMQRRWMLVRNPPDHTRLRTLVHKAFTPTGGRADAQPHPGDHRWLARSHGGGGAGRFDRRPGLSVAGHGDC